MKGSIIRPSDRIRREYQAVLSAAIRRMNREMLREITRAYAEREAEFLTPSEMAGDSSATEWLRGVLAGFFGRWQKNFDDMAEKRAKWFANRTEKASSGEIKKVLKDIGFTVEFKNSDYVNGKLDEIFKENVSLIKSIPEKEYARVEKIVMKGVTDGGDHHYITTELQKEFDVSERRAMLISLDQTNKANAAISLARSEEAGIEYGFWVHRGGSKTPRPTHVKMQGKRFKLTGDDKGIYDSDYGDNVMPGELVACRCAYRPDLSSFRPRMAQDSVSIKPRKATYAEILERVQNPARRAA